MFEAINWPEEMAPSRSPIHFTNELEVAASPQTIWSLLVDPKAWPSFYLGVKHVELLDGHKWLGFGTRFETNLAGQDLWAAVQELEPMTRIAWGGYPKSSEESKAYHARIITPSSKGTHLWTEETMQGQHWVELAKRAPDAFGLVHENCSGLSLKSPASVMVRLKHGTGNLLICPRPSRPRMPELKIVSSQLWQTIN